MPVLEAELLTERTQALEPWVRRIAIAILGQAVRDLRSTDTSSRAEQWKIDAVRWIRSADDEAGSFVWVCQVLDRDPAKARAALRRLGR